jgi:enamine deaminase RidA (YjgF/YER057c/UK114 family)
VTTRRHARSGSPYEARYGFARALRVGDVIEVAGTAPIGPDGRSVDGDAAAQMARCCDIIVAALAELDAGPEHVVRTRIYIIDPSDADAIGQVHARYFGDAAPVATMIVVAGLLDPAWRVEVEAHARLS